MKVQCPSCKEIIDMSDFSTSAEGLSFGCSACGRQHFLPNPHPLAAADDIQGRTTREYPSLAALAAAPLEEVVCPKCGNSQNDAWACHRCGLVFAKFDPSSLPPDPEEAAGIWQQIESRPFESELHERFLRAALQAGRLDYAARQYRLLERKPGLGQLACQYQQRILQMAQASLPVKIMEGTPEKRSFSKTFWLLLALAVLAGLISWALYYHGQMR